MIGIVGASGLIGHALYKFLKKEGENVIGTYFLNKKKGLLRFDLRKDDFSIASKCSEVIITSAIVGIDECFLNRAEAYNLNVERTIGLIKYLADREIKPIFISSDQIFDGKKGNYLDNDAPNPINLYGEYKLMVEEFMRRNLNNYLVVRMSKIYSKDIKENTIFSEILLRLKKKRNIEVAHNQIFNPTDIEMLCGLLYKIIKMKLKNTYNLANHNIMSRYDFALLVAGTCGLDKGLISPVDINNLSLLEKRPLNSSLNVSKVNEELVKWTRIS